MASHSKLSVSVQFQRKLMQGILFQKKKQALASLYTGDSVAFRFYLESIQLRIHGKWREAGDKLVKCADFYASLKMFLETATIYSEAAECYIKVDKSEALLSLRKSIKAYCDIGRFDIAGKIERRIAFMHYRILHWDDALLHFKKASDFFSGDRDLEQSDRCLDKAAECAIQIGNFDEARMIYENIAKSYINTNLRRFQAPQKLMKAIFCMFGKAIIIEDEVPISITKKGKSEKKKNKPGSNSLPAPSNDAKAPHGEGSVVTGGMSSVTSRTSIRSEDDNSSIQTLETRNSVNLSNPAPPQQPVSEGSLDNRQSINTVNTENSSQTGKTSFQDSLENEEAGKPVSSLSFIGMSEDQIHAKLPRDAILNHSLPKEYKYQMSESVKLKYGEIEDRLDFYNTVDFSWKNSKECFFIKNLLKSRKESKYFDFIDHLYYWNNVHPLDDVSLILLKFPVLELEKERENTKITKLNIEVNNAIRTQRPTVFS